MNGRIVGTRKPLVKRWKHAKDNVYFSSMFKSNNNVIHDS